MSKTRVFVFTNFNIDFDYKVKDGVRYIAYALETCPTTGKQHHQGWICFKTQKTLGARSIKSIQDLTGGASHIEPMYGSLQSNDAYCSKEGTLVELGERPAQGDRNDLKAVVGDIRTGKRKVEDIMLEDPGYYHMYGRTLERCEDVLNRKRYRTEMTKGIWYHGPTGVGKTHKALEGFDPDTFYIKPLEDQWWDGYHGQETVVLNDFRGQITFSELLTLVDKWPHSVKRRNREPTPFLAKRLIVTSSDGPAGVYSNRCSDRDSLAQLLRRFEVIELLPETPVSGETSFCSEVLRG